MCKYWLFKNIISKHFFDWKIFHHHLNFIAGISGAWQHHVLSHVLGQHSPNTSTLDIRGGDTSLHVCENKDNQVQMVLT